MIDYDRELLQRQVEASDAAIDTRAYELTEEWIAIVEGKDKKD